MVDFDIKIKQFKMNIKFINNRFGHEIFGNLLKSIMLLIKSFFFGLNLSVVMVLFITLLSVQFSLAADSSVNKNSLSANSSTVVYNLTDLNLAVATEVGVVSDPYPDPVNDTWTPPVGAQNTWYLKDQLLSGNYNSGDDLVKYNAGNSGVFSAFFVKPEDGTIKVKGNAGNQYIELAYTSGAKERGSPALVMDLPETTGKGTLVVNFQLLITNGTSWDWLEGGIGNDCLGSDDHWAEKVIYNGSQMLQTPTGWKGVGGVPYNKDQWYRYVLTDNLSLQTGSLDVYAPGDVTPSQHASYPMGHEEAKRFVIKPIATSSNHAGAIRIYNVAVSYVPPVKTSTLLTPVNGSFMVPLKPNFTWSSTGADSYTLEISKTANFSENLITIPNLIQSTYTMDTELDQFLTYYWRVSSVFSGETDPYTSSVFSFVSDIDVPADKIYNAGSFGLIEGDWDTWAAHPDVTDVPKSNAVIIQGLLDAAGRNGGGKVVLPAGTYCLSGDISIPGSNVLTIKYNNITLTGQGKDANGMYKTILKTNYKWDGPNNVFRSTGITIQGELYGAAKPRQNIEISHFELNGGSGWTGRYDWGYDPTVGYGWDIHNQGIVVSRDNLVTHVTLDDLFVHRYSGETLYVGGKSVGYLEVKNCVLANTNASCFNLYGAYLNVHDNQFGTPDTKCRFWIEYCPRASDIGYEMPPIPNDSIEKDHAYFRNNEFYNAVGADAIAIAQGNCTTYTMIFENNFFDNALSTQRNGLFQFAGAIFGPTIMKNNTIQNFSGPMVVFNYGGGTVPENYKMNKNINFEDNHCTNLSGSIISLIGTFENVVVNNNYFEGSTKMALSVAISNSWATLTSDSQKGVEISGNIFKNCTTPQELGVFDGNLPLFLNNQYIDTKSTTFGGISNISATAPLIKPVYEYLVVNATSAVNATMRTGKNEDGQRVTITGGTNTATVTFLSTEESIEMPENKIIVPGSSIEFMYDATKGKWIFQSFTTTGVASVGEYSGLKVYPNPFGDRLRFEFVSPEATHARIDIYDMTGRMVKTVFNNPVESGVFYNADFKPQTGVSSMYFYRMTIGERVVNGKVVYK